MKPINTANIIEWIAQEWPGNPTLNLQCSVKYFTNPFNGRKVPVFIHGGTSQYPGFVYTVSAGTASEYSYTGCCINCPSLQSAENYVDNLSRNKKLFK